MALNERFPTVLRCYLNSLLYTHAGGLHLK